MLKFKSPRELSEEIAKRVKTCRLLNNWTQAELAERAGISVHTLKHFEQKGEISLLRLLRLAAVLDQLSNFATIFIPEPKVTIQQLREQSQAKKRQRARKKCDEK